MWRTRTAVLFKRKRSGAAAVELSIIDPCGDDVLGDARRVGGAVHRLRQQVANQEARDRRVAVGEVQAVDPPVSS